VDGDAPEDIAVVGQRFFETLRFHPDEFVSHAAHCIETRLDRVFRYRQMREGLPKNSHLPTSQYAAFHPGLECGGLFARYMHDGFTGYRRPVLVVQCNAINRSRIATVLCGPLTSNLKGGRTPRGTSSAVENALRPEYRPLRRQ
jgi:transcriptional regulator of acetoin/glycerol metabolism